MNHRGNQNRTASPLRNLSRRQRVAAVPRSRHSGVSKTTVKQGGRNAPTFYEAEQFEMTRLLASLKAPGDRSGVVQVEPPLQPTGAADAGDAANSQPVVSSAEEWVERINQQVVRSAENLIALGQLFLDAKRALGHGEWQQMFAPGKLRFHLRWAQRLMQAAKNTALTKATNRSLLPPSLYALTTLARLDPEAIERGIRTGVVVPTMTLASARKFVCDQRTPEVEPVAKPFDYDATLRSAAKQLQAAVERVPVEQRSKFKADLIEQLGAAAGGTTVELKAAA